MESLLINSAVNGETSNASSSQPQAFSLPISKIRSLMKVADPEAASINSEAVYAMCRATEMFIGELYCSLIQIWSQLGLQKKKPYLWFVVSS